VTECVSDFKAHILFCILFSLYCLIITPVYCRCYVVVIERAKSQSHSRSSLTQYVWHFIFDTFRAYPWAPDNCGNSLCPSEWLRQGRLLPAWGPCRSRLFIQILMFRGPKIVQIFC